MILWLTALLQISFAQTDPQALACAEKFLSKMSETKGYSLHMQKKELSDGKWLDEPIELWTEGQVIKYKFVADGSSGIKNNGMELIYDGSDMLKIVWGEPTFLGALKNKAARALMGHSVPLISEDTLKGEIFTLNRAGYRHMATILRHHMPVLRKAADGGLKGGDNCFVTHIPPRIEYATVTLKRGDRIQDLEEKYGTFAYHIRAANADRFPTLESLFKHPGDVEIRVPKFFLPFESEIDPATGYPKKLLLFLEGQKIAEYIFTNVKGW